MKSIIIRNSNKDLIVKINKVKNGFDLKKLKHVDKLYITIIGHDRKRNGYVI